MNFTELIKKHKIWLLFTIFIIFNIAYNGTLPLHADEAYYWVWSKRLALSYFDHPPMVAYFMRIISFFGESEIILRMSAVIALGTSGVLLYHLMSLISNDKRVSEAALIIFMFLPLTQAGMMIVTPDTPLVLFWSLFIYSFYRFYFKKENTFAYLMGFSAGASLLSKYTGILAIFFSLLFVISRRDFKIFKKKETIISMIITTIIFSPVILWNYQRDWVSFGFQLSHGVASKTSINFGTFFEFLGSQLGVFNPVFFVALIIFIIKYFKEIKENEELSYLTFIALGTLGLFLLLSLSKKQEANWAAPAYITGSGVLAYFIGKYNYKKTLISGVSITILAICLLKFPNAFPLLKGSASLSYQFRGNDRVFIDASKVIEPNAIVLSDSFQSASLYSYYSKGKNKVYNLDSSRYSNYNMWKDEDNSNLDKIYYVGRDDRLNELKEIYSNIKYIGQFKYQDRIVTREVSVYYCEK